MVALAFFEVLHKPDEFHDVSMGQLHEQTAWVA